MAVLRRLAVDGRKSVDGVWSDWMSGIRLRIARFGNPRHTSALEKLAMTQLAALEQHGTDDWGAWHSVVEAMVKVVASDAAVSRLATALSSWLRDACADGERPDFDGLAQHLATVTLLRDWENVEDDDGKPLEYTQDLGIQYLLDPDFSDLLQFVRHRSLTGSRYRKEDAALGN